MTGERPPQHDSARARLSWSHLERKSPDHNNSDLGAPWHGRSESRIIPKGTQVCVGSLKIITKSILVCMVSRKRHKATPIYEWVLLLVCMGLGGDTWRNP